MPFKQPEGISPPPPCCEHLRPLGAIPVRLYSLLSSHFNCSAEPSNPTNGAKTKTASDGYSSLLDTGQGGWDCGPFTHPETPMPISDTSITKDAGSQAEKMDQFNQAKEYLCSEILEAAEQIMERHLGYAVQMSKFEPTSERNAQLNAVLVACKELSSELGGLNRKSSVAFKPASLRLPSLSYMMKILDEHLK